MKNYEISIPIEIKTYDIDLAGHVNNIVYVRWLEDLRIKLFEKFFPVEEHVEKGVYLVVVSSNINYKKQLKYGEEVEGKMKIESVNHGIILLKYEFISKGIRNAYGEQKCVLMNLKTGKMEKYIPE